jgi:hypothetical protein
VEQTGKVRYLHAMGGDKKTEAVVKAGVDLDALVSKRAAATLSRIAPQLASL